MMLQVLCLLASLLSTMGSSTASNAAFLDCLPSTETIQARVNAAYDDLFRKLPDGSLEPYVCSVCDEFLMCKSDIRVLTIARMKKVRSLLSWTSLCQEDRIEEVEGHYTFTDKLPKTENDQWLEGMALSPRGSMYRKTKNSKPGFTCCPRCEEALMARKPYVPLFAIINKNYVGCAPKCLTDLNDVELAFLTPVATHGYCFTHTGGTQMQLKGTLTFMRIQERRIVEAAAALENLSLTDHVVVLCHGKMTEYQRKRVAEKSKVNTGKLIEAAKWLCKNHARWKDEDYDTIQQELLNKRVVFVDHSESVESTNATVESEELFTCYYPEGAATETSGGFDEPEAFMKFADELQRLNYDVELKVNLEKQFVKESDADQLVGSCLLQFPYGCGGMDEARSLKDGSLSTKMDVPEFLDHVSRLSKREFQKPMVQLIGYSMISRSRLLKKSRLQVRGEKTAKDLAEGLNYEDLHDTIEQRRQGNRYGGTRVSRKLLDSVEACTRALPHTNEFAKTARTTSESMSHYLGMGSIFLTVSFDDDNSLLMQVLSGIEVDDDRDLSELSDKELRARRRERRQIRIKYPGIASVHFEILLNILAEEVVGWNLKENRPTEKPGYFGRCKAFCLAVEEQGRKTLHGHMTLWIEGYKELQHDMFFAQGRKKEDAERTVREYYSRIASTDLFETATTASRERLKNTWDHECTQESKRRRILPQVVSDQDLRVLRHRKGYSENNGRFARCVHCDKSWTYEELVCQYLADGQCPGYTIDKQDCDAPAEIPKHRLFAEVVQYQKVFGPRSFEQAPATAINVAYQTHCSCHTDGCFRCAKGQKNGSVKKSHKCGPKCECRYRMPDRKRKHCAIKTEYKGAPWFEWNGTKKEQPIVQI